MSYNLTQDVSCVSFEEVLSTAPNKQALLLVSGGLDSAYILWKYAQYTDNIICHHLLLNKNISTRTLSELIAVHNQVEYLKSLGKSVTLLISSFDTGHALSPIRDWYACAMLSLDIVKQKKLDYIVVGDDLPDSYIRSQPFSKITEKQQKEITYLSGFINTYTENLCKVCTASESNNLSELYNTMPEDYLKLIFSCRNPIKIHTNNYVISACGACPTCIKNRYFGWYTRIAKELHIEGDINEWLKRNNIDYAYIR